MRKLIITIALAVLFVGNAAQAKDWKKIRIGVEGAYPPFSSMTEDGKLQGFDIDIARALCKQMKAKCTLVPQDWDGIIPALLARKYDAIIASMSITEERKKKVNFTNKYYQTPARFARKKGSGIRITRAGLRGKKVGVQRATIHANFLDGEFAKQVDIRLYGSQDEAYLDAVAGRLDLLMADSVALADGFLNTAQGRDWEFVGPEYTDVKYFGPGAGIAVRKRDRDLTEQFNDAIAAIRANGVYQRINRKYFDFDIYGD